MIRDILLLGEPRLYEVSTPVEAHELPAMAEVVADLHDTLMAYRRAHGAGRAIAAPQIGVARRLIYMHVDAPVVLINPELALLGAADMAVLDDCMSFPGLLVHVLRHRRCRVDFRDLNWREGRLELEGDLSELIQHEYDHLDGILATMRAADNRALVYRPTKARG